VRPTIATANALSYCAGATTTGPYFGVDGVDGFDGADGADGADGVEGVYGVEGVGDAAGVKGAEGVGFGLSFGYAAAFSALGWGTAATFSTVRVLTTGAVVPEESEPPAVAATTAAASTPTARMLAAMGADFMPNLRSGRIPCSVELQAHGGA